MRRATRQRLYRLARSPLSILLVAAAVVSSLALLSAATDGSARFGRVYSPLLVANVLALAVLGALLLMSLLRLARQVRKQRPGSRLTVRMVLAFAVLTLTPVLVVFSFSVLFLLRGIDSWFDVRVEAALGDALVLSRESFTTTKRELRRSTETVASRLALTPDASIAQRVQEAVLDTGADEMVVFESDGRLLAFGNADPTVVVPRTMDAGDMPRAGRAGEFIELEPVGDGRLQLRVVVPLRSSAFTEGNLDDRPLASASLGGDATRLLHAVYPVATRTNRLAENVQHGFEKYRELSYLRDPLKTSFVITLSLVLLLTLATAVWAAVMTARRLVEPLRGLAEGTRAVASGDFERRLDVRGDDEVGFLVSSFNTMTERLQDARTQTRRSQAELEEQRSYLQAVLGRLSTGVLTLDEGLRIHTANEAAGEILGVSLKPDDQRTLGELATANPRLDAFASGVEARARQAAARGEFEWRFETQVFGAGGSRSLTCSGTVLHARAPTDAESPGSGRFIAMRGTCPLQPDAAPLPVAGHVIVFDDVTTLIQAERNAAWSEVARRLAHEIRNPLTPIRLSAERLRHKYLPKLAEKDASTMDRLTRTIEQQVDAMQGMVTAFTEYAHAPRMQPHLISDIDVTQLATDMVELYCSGHAQVSFRIDVADEAARVPANGDQLRQVLANLLKNALDSLAGAGDDQGVGTIEVSARRVERHFELRVMDDGPGFDPGRVDRVFEPYVTTKSRGTGLGLAIVARIAEEHGGSVWAENREHGGACVVFRLPAVRRKASAVPANEPLSTAPDTLAPDKRVVS